MLPPLPSTYWRSQSLRPAAQISFLISRASGVEKRTFRLSRLLVGFRSGTAGLRSALAWLAWLILLVGLAWPVRPARPARPLRAFCALVPSLFFFRFFTAAPFTCAPF